jgi:hypothetical protein
LVQFSLPELKICEERQSVVDWAVQEPVGCGIHRELLVIDSRAPRLRRVNCPVAPAIVCVALESRLLSPGFTEGQAVVASY